MNDLFFSLNNPVWYTLLFTFLFVVILLLINKHIFKPMREKYESETNQLKAELSAKEKALVHVEEQYSASVSKEKQSHQSERSRVRTILHDLSNYITVVSGRIFLAETMTTEVEREIKSELQQARFVAMNLQNFLNAVRLTIDDDYELGASEIKLSDVLNRSVFPSNLEIELKGETDILVLTDEIIFKGMMINFFQNAIKKGATTYLIEIKEGVDSVVLLLKNDGIPLTEEARQKLFRELISENNNHSGSGKLLSSIQFLKMAHAKHDVKISTKHSLPYTVAFEITLPKVLKSNALKNKS